MQLTLRIYSSHAALSWMLMALVVPGCFLIGCSKSDPKTAPVSGIVRFDGKPLPQGFVVFTPKVGRSAFGIIQEDGTFTLGTYGKRDGARIGLHRVTISASKSDSEPRGQIDYNTDDNSTREETSLIPVYYSDPEFSGLQFEVKDGVKNFAEFDLKSEQ